VRRAELLARDGGRKIALAASAGLWVSHAQTLRQRTEARHVMAAPWRRISAGVQAGLQFLDSEPIELGNLSTFLQTILMNLSAVLYQMCWQ
jgi:hypothetical protein